VADRQNQYKFDWIANHYMYTYTGGRAGFMEKRLLRNLFQEYSSLTRPVQNYSDVVTVKFGLSLNQILDLVSYDLLLPNISWTTHKMQL
jgi:hypothetical protein